jgi:uncharacterized membrane protein
VKLSKVNILCLMGVFIALSAVGAVIKVPSPSGTVAFDSAPGFLAALFLGPAYGALSAALGHLFTGFFAGFPLTLPIHAIISLEMAACAAVFGLVGRSHLTTAVIIASLLNGLVAPALFILLPGYGLSFFMAMVGPLVVASAVNIIVSALVYKSVSASYKHFFGGL